MSICERELGRLEYAEEISQLDAEATKAELAVVEHTCDELQTMIMTKYGGLRELASAARGWPAALDLQNRYRAASLRRIELRRKVGMDGMQAARALE